MRQAITFLKWIEKPPNLICNPILVCPTTFASQVLSPEERLKFLKFSVNWRHQSAASHNILKKDWKASKFVWHTNIGFFLKSLKSGPLRALFCQFAQSASHFVSRSDIALKIKVRSRAKSGRAISKSDVPSSAVTYHAKWVNGLSPEIWQRVKLSYIKMFSFR